MMAQYRTKYFNIKELVNPTLLKKIGEKTAWALFDPELLKAADAIREKYGPMTINTKDLTDCGLRDPLSTTGAKYSMHKIGRALDGHVVSVELAAAKIKDPVQRRKYKASEYNRIRTELLAEPSKFGRLNFERASKDYPGGIPWLHFDTGNRPSPLFDA